MKQLNTGNQINFLEHNVKILYIEHVNGFILIGCYPQDFLESVIYVFKTYMELPNLVTQV